MKIKIMVADDQRLMREGLRTILDLQGDMAVVQLAENGRDALDKIAEASPDTIPDVVLMDIRMPVMDGVECTRLIRQKYPGIRVIILTTFDDDEFIIEALKNGAAGYILKDLSAEKLIGAVRDVYGGNSIMQPEIAAKVIARITGADQVTNRDGLTRRETRQVTSRDGQGKAGSDQVTNPTAHATERSGPFVDRIQENSPEPEPSNTEELTEREKDVLRLVGNGMTNLEISQALYISEGTVKNYISNLYGKLGINDRSKLTLYAIGKGYSR